MTMEHHREYSFAPELTLTKKESTLTDFHIIDLDATNAETETKMDLADEDRDHCCRRNVDNCCGDNARGVRDCFCCLGRCTKEILNECRHPDFKKLTKETVTIDNFKRKFPITLWLPKYRVSYFLGDMIAGLTVGLTSLPQGLAYAQIALLPPQYGLYSLFTSCFVYVIFGTSKDVSIGPTTVMSLLIAQFATSPIDGDPTYAILLAMMSGIIQFLMGVFHLGFLVNYISYPVVHGFTMASVITMAFGQVSHLFGLHDIPKEFLQQVYWTFKKLPETQIWDFLLGFVSMVAIFLMKKMKTSTFMTSKHRSKASRVLKYIVWLLSTARSAVVVISTAGLAAFLLYYDAEPFTLTGHVPEGLPSFKPPSFSVSDGNTTYTAGDIFRTIGTGLFLVPLISLVETVAIGKAFARMNNYKIEPNQELLALGIGNFLGSFVSAFPVTATFSRSSVLAQSGSKTPGAGFYTGILSLLVIAFLTPLFYYIPDATLAAIIIMAVMDMADFTLLIELWDVKKIDLIPWLFTFVFSLLVRIDIGLILGIVVSLCILLYPTSTPKWKDISQEIISCQEDYSKVECRPTVLQLNQGATFPSAEHFSEHVLSGMLSGGQSVYRSVVLDFTHVTSIDFTVVRGIQQLSDDFISAGVMLVICQLQPQVLQVLLKARIKNLKCTSTVSDAISEIHENVVSDKSLSEISIIDSGSSERKVKVNGVVMATTKGLSDSTSAAYEEQEDGDYILFKTTDDDFIFDDSESSSSVGSFDNRNFHDNQFFYKF